MGRSGKARELTAEQRAATRALVASPKFELIPMATTLASAEALPSGSMVPVIHIMRLGQVGPSTEQWYASHTVNASASAKWNGRSSRVRNAIVLVPLLGTQRSYLPPFHAS